MFPRLMLKSCAYLTLIFLFSSQTSFTSGVVTSPEVENIKRLYNLSFWDYNTNIRPRLNQSRAIQVNVTFYPMSLETFDTTEQTFVAPAYFVLTWMDELLPWDPKDFSGTESFLVPADRIWQPTILSVSNGDRTLGDKENDLLRVQYTGRVLWYPVQMLSTKCDVSVKYFPFDKQLCQIVMNEGSLNSAQLTFEVSGEISYNLIRPHAEWDILSVVIEKKIHFFSDVIFITYQLQRRPTVAAYSVIAPLLVMGLVNVCLFLLPVTSGEKSSVAITLFLAYGVMMVITSDVMPANSLDVSLLIVYVFVLLLISGFTVVYCIIESRIQSSYGHCAVSLPRWCIGKSQRKYITKTSNVDVNVNITNAHARDATSVGVGDCHPTSGALEEEGLEKTEGRGLAAMNQLIKVEDVLRWLDTAVFVVGFVGGGAYTAVVLVKLMSN